MGHAQYGTGQRLAFGMMAIALILCIVGSASPYWMKSTIDLSDASLGLAQIISPLGSLLDDYKLVEINLGVWVFCIEYLEIGNPQCYSLYTPREDTELSIVGDSDEEDDDIAWIQFVRFAVAVNVAMSLVCVCAACCRCMCASGGKTICHGVFAFIAGGCGVFAFAVMYARREELVPGIVFFEIVMEWSFYLYASGSCLMVLASFLLCFSVPNETHNGIVMSMPVMAGVTHVQNLHHFAVPVNQYQPQPEGQAPTPLPSTPAQTTAFEEPLYPTASKY